MSANTSAACRNTFERTDGGNVRGVEVILGKADDQARFAHSAVPDQQQLEEEIVLFRHDSSRSR